MWYVLSSVRTNKEENEGVVAVAAVVVEEDGREG